VDQIHSSCLCVTERDMSTVALGFSLVITAFEFIFLCVIVSIWVKDVAQNRLSSFFLEKKLIFA